MKPFRYKNTTLSEARISAWGSAKFMIFDLPDLAVPYEQRRDISYCIRLCFFIVDTTKVMIELEPKLPQHAKIVPVIKCESKDRIFFFLAFSFPFLLFDLRRFRKIY